MVYIFKLYIFKCSTYVKNSRGGGSYKKWINSHLNGISIDQKSWGNLEGRPPASSAQQEMVPPVGKAASLASCIAKWESKPG